MNDADVPRQAPRAEVEADAGTRTPDPFITSKRSHGAHLLITNGNHRHPT